jgi:glycosyltransferase involved in cell wall biosynthesis
VARAELLRHVAAWDVALYPRTTDQGIRASKVAEYLGAGVPIVSYDYEVVADIREARAGLLVQTPREFIGAVERLLRNPEERARLADAARAAGAERDWDALARRYAAILDEHLRP